MPPAWLQQQTCRVPQRQRIFRRHDRTAQARGQRQSAQDHRRVTIGFSVPVPDPNAGCAGRDECRWMVRVQGRQAARSRSKIEGGIEWCW